MGSNLSLSIKMPWGVINHVFDKKKLVGTRNTNELGFQLIFYDLSPDQTPRFMKKGV